MKFFIINTDYNRFWQELYTENKGLASRSYDEQYSARMASLFGTADFYSYNLHILGHQGWDVIANIEPMQKQWAREHSVHYRGTRYGFRLAKGVLPWIYRKRRQYWLYDILAAQIRHYRPDILYSMAIETIGSDFLRSIKGYYRLAIGQHAAPFTSDDISEYDLILSSLPNQIDMFRNKGMDAEYLRLGFEPRILSKLLPKKKRFDTVFVGGLSTYHQERIKLLETLCHKDRLSIWGYGIEDVARDSPIHSSFRGTAWGKDMYQIFSQARTVLNTHIGISGPYANNMRLFEATGVGSLVLTDDKINLSSLFEPSKEIVVYKGPKECADLLQYYLEHDTERRAIALAGQKRTLSEHTYFHRMQELEEIVRHYV